MEKLPAYIISERRPDGRQFLVGTREPVFVAEIVVSDSVADAAEKELGFQFGSRTMYKNKCYSLLVVQAVFTKPTEQTQAFADKMARYFRRAADYYLHNYLKKQ